MLDTNTFTAPDGFYYLWYVGNDTADSISSSQTVTYPTNEGTIRCRLSYIENPSCYLTMNTYISNYWPWAEIDTLRTISHPTSRRGDPLMSFRENKARPNRNGSGGLMRKVMLIIETAKSHRPPPKERPVVLSLE